MYISGAMTETVERYSALIHSVNDDRNLAKITSYDNAVEAVMSFISQGMEYPETTELLNS